jgi:23S rRNA-/tRNA-specific pseudouridylate synthase
MKRSLADTEEAPSAPAEQPAPKKPSLTCERCGDSFPSRNLLFIHLRNRHVEGDAGAAAGVDIAATVPVAEEIRVAHEDAWCRVIVKPQGLPTMGTRGGLTVHNHPALRIAEHDVRHCGYRRATPCHRLDALTGGLLVCAKTLAAERALRGAFRLRQVAKRYLAIVQGRLPQPRGVVDLPLSGQAAVTRFVVVDETPSRAYGAVTTVALWPVTGRKHQLRRHMQALGCPIIGDRRYASALRWSRDYPQLFLWSVAATLPHPRHLLAAEALPSDAARGDDSDADDDEDDARVADPAAAPGDEQPPAASAVAGGVRSDDGDAALSTAERLIAALRAQGRDEDVLHVEIAEPPYYEAFRQAQRRQFEEAA